LDASLAGAPRDCAAVDGGGGAAAAADGAAAAAAAAGRTRWRKKLRPSGTDLGSLDLQWGRNLVTFSCDSRAGGRQEVSCQIFLWNWNAKVVVSDVDGTITRRRARRGAGSAPARRAALRAPPAAAAGTSLGRDAARGWAGSRRQPCALGAPAPPRRRRGRAPCAAAVRSDALGHLLPLVGRDWSHKGVTELYSNIRRAAPP